MRARAHLLTDNWDDWFKYNTTYTLVGGVKVTEARPRPLLRQGRMCARRVGQSPVAFDACEACAPPRLVTRALKSLPPPHATASPSRSASLATRPRTASTILANRSVSPRRGGSTP
jgi:hypothetical protein